VDYTSIFWPQGPPEAGTQRTTTRTTKWRRCILIEL